MRSSKHIIGVGASTMQGTGDNQGGFFARLAAHPMVRPEGITFQNEGVGGNSVAHMLARLPEGGWARTHDVLVLLGCNDLPREPDDFPHNRSTLSVYVESLRTLLHRVRGERSLFVSSFAVSEALTGISSTRFGEYMEAAMACARSAGYAVWDLYAESKAIAPHLWAKDGLHFSPHGHSYLANRLVPWVLGEGGGRS